MQGRLIKMKKIIIFSLVTILLLPQSTLALTEADYPAQNIRLYDPKSSACTEAAGSVSADLSKNIPSDWGKIFSAAAEKFDVNPNFLAALYLTEQGNTWKPLNSQWASSQVGASGPMQFMPGTWAGHAQDGNGDGKAEVTNPYDAVFGAAHLIKSMGTDKKTPLGDIGSPWKRQSKTILYAAGEYNWGGGNVQSHTSDSSPLTDAPTETQNYLKNIYELFNSDFTKSGHPNYRDPASTGEGSNGSSVVSASSCANNTGGVHAGSIVETAKGLINKDNPGTASQAYIDARAKYNPEAGGDMNDCGKYVSTVMRASGADPDYPSAGTSIQRNYVMNSPKYTIINTKSPSDLQPGDILVNNGHTMLYIGDQGNGNVAAEASLGDHPPRYANIGRVQTQLGFSDNVVARLNK
ncbi:MAG: lytic transglycosylase domain-containing protein [Candidatus Nanosynbacter sp. P2B_S1_bin.0.1]|nr:lytic transglycosylase domain-containing protein [Candidatus Nanosynbacter sp. P2B_S1_bin.0.1]